MLAQYFGFSQEPFGATPDPRFLYSSPGHQEALASLQYGYHCNRGFTALIAPPGMGKTTLLLTFLDRIRDAARTVFIFDTQYHPRELIEYILRDLGVQPGRDMVEMHDQLYGVVLELARARKKLVVVIDEAQNLCDEALETVRLLTNFETPQAKLMQIVLAGQPQLSDTLLKPDLVQLRQRISTICRIAPLQRREVTAYIGYRLAVAGYSGPPLFAETAIELIARESHGIPRLINTLCFNSLSICCALRRKRVVAEMVAEAVADQQLAATQGESDGQTATMQTPAEPIECRNAQLPKRPLRPIVLRFAVLLAVIAGLAIAGIRWRTLIETQGNNRTGSNPVRQSAREKPSLAQAVPAQNQLEYTVEPNDRLSELAVKRLGRFDREILDQIRELNPGLANPDVIQPGQRLRFPDLRSTKSPSTTVSKTAGASDEP